MLNNDLFEIRTAIINGKKQGWLEEPLLPEINRVLREMDEATIPQILKKFEEEEILSEGQIQLIEAQLKKYRESERVALKKRLFEINNVYKSYQTPEGAFHALRGVNLSIYQGEMLALMGFSGSGKSTLLNILGLLITPDNNSQILYTGTHYAHLNNRKRNALRKKEFGFIFQESHLLNHLNALENVSLPLRMQKVSGSLCLQRAEKMLSRFMTKQELENKKTF